MTFCSACSAVLIKKNIFWKALCSWQDVILPDYFINHQHGTFEFHGDLDSLVGHRKYLLAVIWIYFTDSYQCISWMYQLTKCGGFTNTTKRLQNASVLQWGKGAGTYSGQGGQIARKGHQGRRRRIAWSGGETSKNGILFCYYNFLLILAQSKHKFGTLLPPWAEGDRGSRLLWPRCPAPSA